MPYPVIYWSGILKEAESEGVIFTPRFLSSPSLYDVNNGELVYDTVANRLILRTGDFLRLFMASNESVSTPSSLDFSDPDNSIWIGVIA